MLPRLGTVALGFLLLLSNACATLRSAASNAGKCGPDTEPCARSPYAGSGWATVHASSRNDDYVPIKLPQQYELSWTVLEGFATLMGPSIGPEGNLYITTPSSPGTPTLHAFDSDGNTLWESDPWEGPADLDSCAGYQTPVVDGASAFATTASLAATVCAFRPMMKAQRALIVAR